MEYNLLKIIVFLPLIGAIVSGLGSSKISSRFSQIFNSVLILIVAVCSVKLFYDVIISDNTYITKIFTWINVGDFKSSWELKADSITALMIFLVTWVSACVHIYSIGYMSHDPHVPRFMSYLSLFTFFMLLLVTSSNFLQLFAGWEGVGLCSYLLIGFWFKKPEAKAAAMKAFIVNRVGDFGFIIGIFTIYIVFGTLSFSEVFANVASKSTETISFIGDSYNAITFICVLLFIGAMGKSAQIGLHTWLPDAMEGPTPVSALIHAATMVTAGVFLVVRCSPLFEYSDFALNLVTCVGAFTSIFAATIAITQTDIKRVIAYSTCSQLGYMFFACGVSAYPAAMFHLVTHGFFKALLFLCAGSVIHALSNEQDMRKMGGIMKKIPYTYVMMLIGTISIVGIPPLSGFFSKDIILESAYAAGENGNVFGRFAFILGVSAAFLTSFYSWRLIFLVFHGKSRVSKDVEKNIHESPKVMLIPLMILSLGAVFAGWLGADILSIVDHDLSFWNNSIFISIKDDFNILEEAHNIPDYIKHIPLLVGLLGFALSFLCYIYKTNIPSVITNKFSFVYKFLLNKWYFDELYNCVFVRTFKALGLFLWEFIDVKIIDNLGPNGMVRITQRLATKVSLAQTGYIFTYVFVMIIGLLVFMGFYVLRYF